MPRLIEPDRWDRLIALLAKGYLPAEAARETGIDVRTVARFISGDPRSSGRRRLEARKAAAAIHDEMAV